MRGTVENDDDRRLERRVPINLPVAAKPIGWIRKKTALVGRTINLALSGLQLRLDGKNKIKAGDAVEIRILVPDDRAPILLEGRVRWLTRVEGLDDTIRVGVLLTDLDQENYDSWVRFLYTYLED
jgi:hypothetical protein